MKHFLISLLGSTLILFLGTDLLYSKNEQTPSDKKHIPGQVLVKMKKTEDMQLSKRWSQSVASLANSFKTEQLFSANYPDVRSRAIALDVGLDRWIVLHVSDVTNISALVEELRSDPRVEKALPNYLEEAHFIPNDSLLGNNGMQHLSQVKAFDAWDISRGDSTVLVAVIDTGVDWDHPDLANAIFTNKREIPGNGIDDDGNGKIDDVRGWDFVTGVAVGSSTNPSGGHPDEDLDQEDNNPTDFNGHGSHVAGIVAAVTNNGIGVAALAGGVKILPCRIGWQSFDGRGFGNSVFMSRAFQYAADMGATSINLSYGTSTPVLEGALYAFKKGSVITKSAGNSNNEAQDPLTSTIWALKVASVDDRDFKASYSSYGTWVNISSPGGDLNNRRPGILSTVPHPNPFYNNNQYEQFQGTSMASPLVASLAALIKSHRLKTPGADTSAVGIMFQIFSTADPIDGINPNFTGKLGYGRINAYRALTESPPPLKPQLEIINVSIRDSVGGNNNRKLEPGETAELIVAFRNMNENATNASATISTTNWAVTINKGSSTYGTMVGLRNIDNNVTSNLIDPFRITIHPDSIPNVIEFNLSMTANNGYTQNFTFTIPVLPTVLIVDDDDGQLNINQYYTSVFNSLSIAYDVWDRSLNGPLPPALMNSYKHVVWACEWAFPSLDSLDRNVISGYLAQGGNLFLSGQDIGWDLAAIDEGEEYIESGGASKTWMENTLKFNYVSDNAGSSSAVGVTNDIIGNGLSFQFTLPGRTTAQQYPDVISPRSGATTSIRYSTNTTAAIRWTTGNKVVFFGFGGFEAITNAASRVEIGKRILEWFTAYQFSHTPLKDTESTLPYRVNATITAADPIESVSLYWNTSPTFPANKVPMVRMNDGVFEGDIPGQTNTSIHYTIVTRTSGGYMNYKWNSFYAGTDNVKPNVTALDTVLGIMSTSGVVPVSFTATDNTTIDTSKGFVVYRVNSSPTDSVKLNHVGNGNFIGTMNLLSKVSQIKGGDTISYYYSVSDASSQMNWTRFPDQTTIRFNIGRQMIDNFEKVRNIWDTGAGWGIVERSKLGLSNRGITDSPTGNYLPNMENTLTLSSPVDLSSYAGNARMRFERQSRVNTSDTLYVEYRQSSGPWITLVGRTGITIGFTWLRDSVEFPAGNANTQIRFRLKTNASTTQQDGVYLDDIQIVAGPYIVTSVAEEMGTVLPSRYDLGNNYPNPFNPSTSISFTLPERATVSLVIYDALGREVMVLLNKELLAGTHSVQWNGIAKNGGQFTSGIYFYRLRASSNGESRFDQTKKMLLMK